MNEKYTLKQCKYDNETIQKQKALTPHTSKSIDNFSR